MYTRTRGARAYICAHAWQLEEGWLTKHQSLTRTDEMDRGEHIREDFDDRSRSPAATVDDLSTDVVEERKVPLQNISITTNKHRHVAATHQVNTTRQWCLEEVDAGPFGKRSKSLDLFFISLWTYAAPH